MAAKTVEFQPGDRVELSKRGVTVWGGSLAKFGTVRSVKHEEGYAVVAMEPYGNLVMPRLDTLKLVKGG